MNTENLKKLDPLEVAKMIEDNGNEPVELLAWNEDKDSRKVDVFKIEFPSKYPFRTRKNLSAVVGYQYAALPPQKHLTDEEFKSLKPGDKVRIVEKAEGTDWNSEGRMKKWLGTVMTVREHLTGKVVQMEEDIEDINYLKGWHWYPHMIAEIVERAAPVIQGRNPQNAPTNNLPAEGGRFLDEDEIFFGAGVDENVDVWYRFADWSKGDLSLGLMDITYYTTLSREELARERRKQLIKESEERGFKVGALVSYHYSYPQKIKVLQAWLPHDPIPNDSLTVQKQASLGNPFVFASYENDDGIWNSRPISQLDLVEDSDCPAPLPKLDLDNPKHREALIGAKIKRGDSLRVITEVKPKSIAAGLCIRLGAQKFTEMYTLLDGSPIESLLVGIEARWRK